MPSEEKGLESRPEADNLVGIYAALSGRTKADVLGEFGGGQFSGFKNSLVELCVAKLSPIALEMKRLVADPGRRAAFGQAGRRKVLGRSWPALTEELIGHYAAVLGRKLTSPQRAESAAAPTMVPEPADEAGPSGSARAAGWR